MSSGIRSIVSPSSLSKFGLSGGVCSSRLALSPKMMTKMFYSALAMQCFILDREKNYAFISFLSLHPFKCLGMSTLLICNSAKSRNKIRHSFYLLNDQLINDNLNRDGDFSYLDSIITKYISWLSHS